MSADRVAWLGQRLRRVRALRVPVAATCSVGGFVGCSGFVASRHVDGAAGLAAAMIAAGLGWWLANLVMLHVVRSYDRRLGHAIRESAMPRAEVVHRRS
jgi:hypothetical protein